MTNQPLESPENRMVADFDEIQQAEAARESLLQSGFTAENVRLFSGEEAAEKVDASARWFADTDTEIQRYKRRLAAGHAVLSVSVTDGEHRKSAEAIATEHNSTLVTHFGHWVTKTINPNQDNG